MNIIVNFIRDGSPTSFRIDSHTATVAIEDGALIVRNGGDPVAGFREWVNFTSNQSAPLEVADEQWRLNAKFFSLI